MSLIQPRTLRGFRDYLPEAMMPRERLVDVARKVYRSYGFVPIDTPALEYEEILTGKGGAETDKQMYRFEDHGGRRVALRFDLTVPLARFAAQYSHELGLPFKRYHIASVWRGENTQRGRYREFMQCDFDTIGTESSTSDVETALVILDLFAALEVDATVHVNDRKVLNGLLERLELADRSGPVLRALDKLDKVGPEKVAEEIRAQAGASAAQAAEVLELAQLRGANAEILRRLEPLVGRSDVGRQGVARLAELVEAVRAVGVDERRVQLDVSIARGLDYYTGVVFETTLDALPSIGSVCSGGRYDDLAQLYTKERLPGVGASLGLDRLLSALEELGKIEKTRTAATALIAFFDESRRNDYLRLAARLRAAGVGVELYPDAKKLGHQLKYADRRGFRFALVAGAAEWGSGRCQVKDLAAGTSADAPMFDAAGAAHPELVARLS